MDNTQNPVARFQGMNSPWHVKTVEQKYAGRKYTKYTPSQCDLGSKVWANTEIYKFSTTQIHKFTNTQIHKNTQIRARAQHSAQI